MREYLLCLFIAAATTFLLTPVVRNLAIKAGAMTEIRSRDVHKDVTPRWGGLAMFGGLLSVYLLAAQLPRMAPVFEDTRAFRAVLVSAFIIVLLGALDDVFNLDALTKLAGQALAAGLLAYQGVGFVWLPLGNATLLDPYTSLALTVVVVVVIVNAVNFIDGLDGLAAGVIGIAALASFVYSYWLSGNFGLERATLSTLIGATIAGIAIGFLPHNFNPAKIFMGDTGSLALGSFLGTVSLITKHEIALLIAGGLFVLEAASVIIQVTSFKLFGKRVFRMAPLHHHFEKKGWQESTIVIRFWIISVILVLLALSTLKLR